VVQRHQNGGRRPSLSLFTGRRDVGHGRRSDPALVVAYQGLGRQRSPSTAQGRQGFTAGEISVIRAPLTGVLWMGQVSNWQRLQRPAVFASSWRRAEHENRRVSSDFDPTTTAAGPAQIRNHAAGTRRGGEGGR
jgi:hypothetical protein